MTILPTVISQSPARNRGSAAGRLAAVAIILLLSIAIILGWDQIERLGMYGYPAVFVVSLLSNAALFLPAPGFALVVAAGSTLDPVALGIIAGLGAAIGEMTGFVAGQSGQAVLKEGSLRRRIEQLMGKAGALVILLLAAIPNPAFDVGGIIAGMLRMPAWRFFLAAWLGKSLRFSLLAALGGMAL